MYITHIVPFLLFYYSTFKLQIEAAVTEDEYSQMPVLFHLDNFDDCMVYGKKALYCSISLQLAPENNHNASTVWDIIKNVSDNPRNYRHDLLRHSICVTTSCPSILLNTSNEIELRKALSVCYTSKLKNDGLKATVVEMSCEKDEPNYPIDNYDIAVAIAFGILILIVILGTFYEGLARNKSSLEYERITNTRIGKIATCFSLPKNWSRLRSNNEEPGAFKGINGMRFYNTILVIITHVSMIGMTGSVSNPTFVENLTRIPGNMLFLNGASAIQTFFFITGYLLSYKFLEIFENHKQFKVKYLVMTFVNRYIRLTPCLIAMIAFNSSWLYHISRGPLWNRLVGTEYRNCRRNWWANLLYINNHYDFQNVCMQHTWYLATDTQLFIVALIVLGFMWKYQKRIKLILGIALAMGYIMPAAVNYYYNFDIVIRQYPEAFYNLFLNVPQWKATYASPTTNFGGYAIGMVFGYIAYKNSKTNTNIFTKKIYVAVWWLLVWGLPLSTIFYGILIYQDNYQYTRLGAAVYVSLHKNLFALGLMVCAYGMSEGIGWFLRDSIMWRPAQILGRLTYSTYLVHVAVIRVRGGQVTSPTFLSNYWIFTHTMSDTVVSYIFATLLALFVEFPVTALQKLMVPQLANKKDVYATKNENNNTADVAMLEKKSM